MGQRVLGGTEGAGLSGAVLPQRKTAHSLPQVRVRLYGRESDITSRWVHRESAVWLVLKFFSSLVVSRIKKFERFIPRHDVV